MTTSRKTPVPAPRQRTNLNRAIGRSKRTAARTTSAFLLHLLRKSYGLTQRQLARAVGGVALETVTRWESGAQVPGGVARRVLAHALACDFLADWNETVITPKGEEKLREWVESFRAAQTKKSGAGA